MKCTWSFDVYEMIPLKNAHRICEQHPVTLATRSNELGAVEARYV
jgi:hypothetical protein